MQGSWRIAVCAGTATIAVMALATAGLAKEGFVATLTSAVPANAKPGATLDVGWTISRPAASGAATPFNATEVFVRLRSATGGTPTEGFATYGAHTDGSYQATVTVPTGGIGRVEIGVAGTRTYASGKSERADLLFPLTNPPLRSPASAASRGAGVWSWLWPTLTGVLVAGAGFVGLRRVRYDKRRRAAALSSH